MQSYPSTNLNYYFRVRIIMMHVSVCECVQVYDQYNLPITVVICDILQQIRVGNFLG